MNDKLRRRINQIVSNKVLEVDETVENDENQSNSIIDILRKNAAKEKLERETNRAEQAKNTRQHRQAGTKPTGTRKVVSQFNPLAPDVRHQQAVDRRQDLSTEIIRNARMALAEKGLTEDDTRLPAPRSKHDTTPWKKAHDDRFEGQTAAHKAEKKRIANKKGTKIDLHSQDVNPTPPPKIDFEAARASARRQGVNLRTSTEIIRNARMALAEKIISELSIGALKKYRDEADRRDKAGTGTLKSIRGIGQAEEKIRTGAAQAKTADQHGNTGRSRTGTRKSTDRKGSSSEDQAAAQAKVDINKKSLQGAKITPEREKKLADTADKANYRVSKRVDPNAPDPTVDSAQGAILKKK